MRFTAITTTTKATRTLAGGAIISAGTSYLSGVIIDTLNGNETAIRQTATDALILRIARSKDKAEKKSLRAQLRREGLRGVTRVTGTAFLLLLSRVHPTIELDNDGKAALGRLIKGVQIMPELIAEA